MASAKSTLASAASLAASAMLVRSMAKDLIPRELRSYLFSSLCRFLSRFTAQITITIEEFDGFALNQIYAAAEIYLGSISSTTTTKWLRVSKPVNDKNILVVADENQEIVDHFEGMELKWTPSHSKTESMTHHSHDHGSSFRHYARYFTLSFHKKHLEKVLHSYLPRILALYKSMKEAQKGVKLYTIKEDRVHGRNQDPWISINLDHPSTFHTLAMDPGLKGEIMADLDRFLERKDYYRKVGKAWKRGYLLYGPPGTGKSSLIAAMANYLNFSIYDLELTDLQCNSELRKLLVATANRSILVVEDIDCSIDLNDRKAEEQPVVTRRGRMIQPKPDKQFTLSGLLNFIDGLWSSCGDERIIIFTTNHKEKLDPALLRPGRMDMHIHMSYCKFNAFKVLAANYLSIQDHKLFAEIEVLMEEVDVTPAEVAEELMKSDNSDIALEGLVKFVHEKKMVAIQEKERAAKEDGEEEVEGKGKHVKKDKDIECVNGKHEELQSVII